MKRNLGAALLLLGLAVLTTPCFAVINPILVPTSEWTGNRSTPTDVIASDGWSETNGGFKISWQISALNGIYTYIYTLGNVNGSTPTLPNTSHLLIEVSSTFTANNILAGTTPAAATGDPKVYSKDASLTYVNGVPTPQSLQNCYNTGSPGQNNGNPCMPADIYALKFDFGSQNVVTLVTDRAPIWGDFYAKDGSGGSTNVLPTAWNAGFGTDPAPAATSFNSWIPTPDTLQNDPPDVPEPGTIALIATGIGAILLRRRLASA